MKMKYNINKYPLNFKIYPLNYLNKVKWIKSQLVYAYANIFERSLKLNSIPSFKLFYYKNYWNCSSSLSDKVYPNYVKYFFAPVTDILYDFSLSECDPV